MTKQSFPQQNPDTDRAESPSVLQKTSSRPRRAKGKTAGSPKKAAAKKTRHASTRTAKAPRRAVPYLGWLEREGRKPQFVIYDSSDPKNLYQEFTGTTDPAVAQAKLADYLARKAKNPAEVRNAFSMTFKEIIADFWDRWLEPRDTIRYQRLHAADMILKKFWGNRTISQITEETCKAYAKDRGIASGTARGELKRLKTLVKWHTEARHKIAFAPQWWLPERSPPREVWFNRQQIARLICAARGRTFDPTTGDWKRRPDGLLAIRPPHHQSTRGLIRLILLGVFTATRGDAMIRTRWPHARDNNHPWLQLKLKRPLYHRRGPAEPASRNKRRPPARLCAELLRMIHRWEAADQARGCAHVITKYEVIERKRMVTTVQMVEGKPVYRAQYAWVRDAVPTTRPFVKETDAGEVFRALRRFAGISDDATIHATRHTAITWLLEDAPIESVAAYAGLTVEEVERTYAKYDPAFTAPAARALNEWGRARRPGPTGKGAFNADGTPKAEAVAGRQQRHAGKSSRALILPAEASSVPLADHRR